MTKWSGLSTLKTALTKAPLADFKLDFNKMISSSDSSDVYKQTVFLLGGCSITQAATKKLTEGATRQGEFFTRRKFWSDSGLSIPEYFVAYMAAVIS